MIIAIISIFVPIGGVYLTIVAALLAAFAAGSGLSFGVVAILINLFNLVFMSPSLWIAEASAASEGASGPGAILVGIQIAAAVILSFTHIAKGKKQAAGDALAWSSIRC